jgi:hypothetical protein
MKDRKIYDKRAVKIERYYRQQERVQTFASRAPATIPLPHSPSIPPCPAC